jgi:hypothetical protein
MRVPTGSRVQDPVEGGVVLTRVVDQQLIETKVKMLQQIRHPAPGRVGFRLARPRCGLPNVTL